MKIFIYMLLFFSVSSYAFSQSEEITFSAVGIKVTNPDTLSWSWDIYEEKGEKSLGIYTNEQYIIIGIGVSLGKTLDESVQYAQKLVEMGIGEVEFNWEKSEFKGMPAMATDFEYISQNQTFKSKVLIFQHPNGNNIQVGVLIQDEFEKYKDQIDYIINSIEVIEK